MGSRFVGQAKAEGWLPRLLAEAAAVNPGNRQLADVVSQYRPTSPGGGGGGTPADGSSTGARGRSGVRPSATLPPTPAEPPSDRVVIGTLANEFPDLADARRLVSQAGLRPGRQPAWNVANAELFWREVHRLFDGGAVLGGWANVLREAYHVRPANGVLAAAARAVGAADPSPSGGTPSSGRAPAGSPTLAATGFSCRRGTCRGANWVVGMQNGVQRAARTVAVLSAAYGQSVYGAAEWQAAWAADPDGAGRKLLVFRVEDCDRPGLLGQVVSHDLFSMTQDKAGTVLLEAAKLAVGGGRAKPPTRPPFPGTSRTPPFPAAELQSVQADIDSGDGTSTSQLRFDRPESRS
ncbi:MULTISPECIES: toll/interleukin-1 receptor domain-containing protein [unclassified Frankia]|uniref:toll/interleukin-1 receptor domain-containing protein n=1 Tax=unclassified Frankia TaxID=2632575 RepID=UPI002AD34E8B|nr:MULTISPECIES: toll/interleukin-1 receptor domain-containing protein [unclassified Frankia]